MRIGSVIDHGFFSSPACAALPGTMGAGGLVVWAAWPFFNSSSCRLSSSIFFCCSCMSLSKACFICWSCFCTSSNDFASWAWSAHALRQRAEDHPKTSFNFIIHFFVTRRGTAPRRKYGERRTVSPRGPTAGTTEETKRKEDRGEERGERPQREERCAPSAAEIRRNNSRQRWRRSRRRPSGIDSWSIG